MAIRRKIGLIVAGIAALLLLALIFVAAALIRVDRYRPQVISYLQEKIGKQVEIGRLALTFFPVAIHIDHFGVKNPPIFPRGYGVDVDGSGSVSVSGSDELNYRGLAEITTKESFFTNTVARLSGAALKDGKLQFPFRIGGTIDNPVFSKGKGDKDLDAVQKPR